MNDKSAESRLGDAVPIEEDQRMVFAIALPTGPAEPPTIVLGLSKAAIDYMRANNSHTIDLRKAGIFAQLIVFTGETRQACIDVIAAANGGPPPDHFDVDFGIVPKAVT